MQSSQNLYYIFNYLHRADRALLDKLIVSHMIKKRPPAKESKSMAHYDSL
jgi:hypothetical protein